MEAVEPEYTLGGVARDLPGRGVEGYQLEFTLVRLRTREVVWTNSYEVLLGGQRPESPPSTSRANVPDIGKLQPSPNLKPVTNNVGD